MATAYILRWNKPDYKEIIGVFLTKDNLASFIAEHFTREEALQMIFDEKNSTLKVEEGRYYEPMKW
jgi:hypothetical protein